MSCSFFFYIIPTYLQQSSVHPQIGKEMAQAQIDYVNSLEGMSEDPDS